MKPGLLCGNNLDIALGILDDQKHGDVYVDCLQGSIATGCKSGALLVEVIGTGVALGIGISVVLILHFLRKPHFLRVILPYPSALIQY